jgi:DNA repair exonuclease SbcCD ATPase subunit
MQLVDIHIKNFLSIKDAQIDFPKGIISVIGQNKDVAGSNSNGSGKSALFDAISWVLFGQTLRPIDKDSVVRRGTEEAQVELIFESDGMGYLINRKRGKDNALAFYSVPDSDLHKAIELTGSTLSITQDKINAVLGMDYKTFLAVATFDLDIMRFARATDKEQKEILERILNLEIYGKALEKVRKELGDKERTLELVNENKKFLNQQVNECKVEIGKLTIAKDNHKKSIEEKTAQTLTTIAELKEKNNDLGKEIVKAKAEQDSLQLMMSLPIPKSKVIDRYQSAKEYYNSLSYQISTLTTKKNTKELSIDNASARIGKPCKECGKEILEQDLSHLIESGAEEVLKLMDELETLQASLKAAEETRNNLKAEYESEQNEQAKISENRSNAVSRHGVLGTLIRKHELAQSENEKSIIRLESSLRELQSSTETYETRINALSEKVQSLEKQIKDKDKEIVIITDNMAILKYWEKGFGYQGIRSVLLDDVCATITEKSNEYLKHLMGGTLWIECTTQATLKSGDKKERFDIKTFNQYGAGTYFGNSKGEQQRIDIALALALQNIAKNRNKNPLGFAIFDEVFERLDENGCDMLISLLHKERNNLGTIFVVTNNPNFSTRFGKTIEFIKQNGITQCINTNRASNLTPTVSQLPPSQSVTPVQAMISPKTGRVKRKATSSQV